MSVLHQWVGLVEWFSWLLATWVSISNTHIITLRLWIYIPALALLWSPSMWAAPRCWEWRLSRFMRSLSGLLGLIGALLSLWWRILLDVLVSISCIFFTWTIGAGLGVEDDRLMSTCARSLICMVDFGWVRLAVSCISLAAVGCCLLNFLISVFWILWEWRNPTMCYDDVCLLPGWCSWCSNKIFFFCDWCELYSWHFKCSDNVVKELQLSCWWLNLYVHSFIAFYSISFASASQYHTNWYHIYLLADCRLGLVKGGELISEKRGDVLVKFLIDLPRILSLAYLPEKSGVIEFASK